MNSAIKHIRALGFAPSTVLEVGAATGTRLLLNNYPESNHFMIKALEEYIPKLEEEKSMEDADYLIAAVTSENGPIILYVHPDLVGYSVYLEDEDSNMNAIPREVPVYKLDEHWS